MNQATFSRDPTMSEHDVDDIAFLTGSPHGSGFLVSKRAMYEHGSVMVCSQKRACLSVSFGFLAIIGVAVIVAFTKPGCPEAKYTGEPISGYDGGGVKKRPQIHFATNGEEFPWQTIRLPSYIEPIYYSLFLYPNFTSGLVRGNISIMITAAEETHMIVLHGRDLNISHYTLEDKYKQKIDIVKFLVFPLYQQVYFELSDILHRGSNYTLHLVFETWLRENLDGFYLAAYRGEDKQRRYIATTHFEPASARSAFPCFDEPQMKARFRLSMVREQDMFSLFNMPLKASYPYMDTGLIVDEFYESVEMSTYLVAFVVCDYANITNRTSNGVRVSIYAPSTMISQAQYALDVSIKILEYYEKFFGVAYPLPKQDLVAIPNFAAGAMENWGLITYQETALMFEPDQTSIRAQQRVTRIIAHELAHQWFGNLVTMSWWQDLWLNEGFASFMENIGTAIAEPGWAINEQFIIDMVQPALALDSLLATHSVSIPVDNPADIESIFDTISYKKGASIISMLGVFMDRPILKAGLRKYLTYHRYSTANTDDLWRALTQATKEANATLNVKEIMDTWILQAGFPLVTVRLGDVMANATQARFVECEDNMTDPNSPLNKTAGYLWHIPLTYISSHNPKDAKLVWMNATEVEFGIPKDITWIKFNVGQRGLYRVHYDGSGWQMLTSLLLNDHTSISAADRASIIDDAFSLVRAGQISADVVLDLSLYLRKETAFAPWVTAISHLLDWAQLMFHHPAHSLMMEYIHFLIEPHYKRLGWNDTGTYLEKLLRSEMLIVAVACKDHEAIAAAREMFLNWRIHNETVPPNLRRVVYPSGIRYGLVEDWQFCWEVYNSSLVPSEKKLMLKALSQTRDPWVLQQFLEYILDRSKIRTQDILTVFMEVTRNPGGQLPAWRMLRKHWTEITDLFGRGSFTIGAIIKAVTTTFSTSFDLEEVKAFFEGKDLGSGVRALAQSLETIRLHMQWHRDNLDNVVEWLTRQLSKTEEE